MSEPRLVEPSIGYKDEYIDMIEEWKGAGEKMIPFVLRYDCTDFDAFLRALNKLRDGPFDDERTVPSSTYWLVSAENRVVGCVNIRHRLNESLTNIGGHIGYGIRPSERRKGYATRILRLALVKAGELGIEQALITCDKANVGSARTILNNHGVLASEAIVDGVEIQRYWIEL